MATEGASLIYVGDCQKDMRVIARPTVCGSVVVEMANNSLVWEDIENSDQFALDLLPAEAREIAAALILAADTAEKQQEEAGDA